VCLLPPTFYLLPPAFYYCLLPSVFCFLISAFFCLLPSVFYLLPFALCLVPSSFCLLPATSPLHGYRHKSLVGAAQQVLFDAPSARRLFVASDDGALAAISSSTGDLRKTGVRSHSVILSTYSSRLSPVIISCIHGCMLALAKAYRKVHGGNPCYSCCGHIECGLAHQSGV